MTFAADFPELLVDAVEWARVTGRDEYDEPSYATVVTLPAMIEHRVRIIRGAGGEEMVTQGEALVSGTPAIGPDDRVVLRCPGMPAFDGLSPPVLDVAPQRDYDRAPYMTRILF